MLIMDDTDEHVTEKQLRARRQIDKLMRFTNAMRPRGMSAELFEPMVATGHKPVTLADARRLHAAWRKAWPESGMYFDSVAPEPPEPKSIVAGIALRGFR